METLNEEAFESAMSLIEDAPDEAAHAEGANYREEEEAPEPEQKEEVSEETAVEEAPEDAPPDDEALIEAVLAKLGGETADEGAQEEAEAQRLLAGKYKSAADLEKGYDQLQREFTRAAQERANLRNQLAAAERRMQLIAGAERQDPEDEMRADAMGLDVDTYRAMKRVLAEERAQHLESDIATQQQAAFDATDAWARARPDYTEHRDRVQELINSDDWFSNIPGHLTRMEMEHELKRRVDLLFKQAELEKLKKSAPNQREIIRAALLAEREKREKAKAAAQTLTSGAKAKTPKTSAAKNENEKAVAEIMEFGRASNFWERYS